jgi:hypothetical protein
MKFWAVLLTLFALSASAQDVMSSDKASARQAYLFAYPLVLMDATRTVALARQAANTFNHAAAFPDDRFRAVVRPNADTLYSTAWLDLAAEPVLMHVPDTHGRYYLMQIMDAWTETIAAPGKRTTGTGEKWFAIVGPNWKGVLPKNVQRIDCPTNWAWIIGRTQTNSAEDYENVHAIQRGYQLVPLSGYPNAPAAPKVPGVAGSPVGSPAVPPPMAVDRMTAAEFFARFNELLKQNPAHAADTAALRDVEAATRETNHDKQALEDGVAEAKAILKKSLEEAPASKEEWGSAPANVGRYGVHYAARAVIARIGLGALPPEDAVYRNASRDISGDEFDGSKTYLMHFEKGKLPPAGAFWSLTMYDEQGYFVANPIRRFAIGDRDKLKFNDDGSLDIRIQHDAPADADKSNWLPASAGHFRLSLRMYWPGQAIIDGKWTPPAVMAVCGSC